MKKQWIFIIGALMTIVLFMFTGCVAAQPANATTSPKTVTTAEGTVRILTGEEAKKPTIAASGKGEIKVTPDMAYITVGVTTQSTNAKKASEDNSVKMNALYAAVKALGIAETDIKTVNYSLSPQYDYTTSKPKITGYTASNIVTITVKDIKKASDVIDAAVDAGGNELREVTFDLLNKTKAYADALTAAVKDAKSKVDTMAAAVGITQISPLTITESSYTVYNGTRQVAAAKDESTATTPISAGELNITANVSVEFEILK